MTPTRLKGPAMKGTMDAVESPTLPRPSTDGNYDAVDYARASLARNIVRDRVNAGLTQRELARLARIRIETLCRIETGKHTATVPTIEKIDRALRRAAGADRETSRRSKSG